MRGAYGTIIVGSDHNGLVTAMYFACVDWELFVLDRNESVSGTVPSGEATRERKQCAPEEYPDLLKVCVADTVAMCPE